MVVAEIWGSWGWIDAIFLMNPTGCFLGFLENKLLLISINFTPKTSHSCLKKWYTRFSRLLLNRGILPVLIWD